MAAGWHGSVKAKFRECHSLWPRLVGGVSILARMAAHGEISERIRALPLASILCDLTLSGVLDLARKCDSVNMS